MALEVNLSTWKNSRPKICIHPSMKNTHLFVLWGFFVSLASDSTVFLYYDVIQWLWVRNSHFCAFLNTTDVVIVCVYEKREAVLH